MGSRQIREKQREVAAYKNEMQHIFTYIVH